LRDGVVINETSLAKFGDGEAFDSLLEQNIFGFDIAMD